MSSSLAFNINGKHDKDNTTTYEYDLMGNRIAVFKTNESGTIVESEKSVYNESNQVTDVTIYYIDVCPVFKELRLILMKIRRWILIVSPMVLIFGIGFVIWVCEGIREEHYRTYNKTVEMYVEMPNTDILEIYNIVKQNLENEVKDYYLSQVNFEISEGIDGIENLELHFVGEICSETDFLSSKVVIVQPKMNFIQEIRGYEGIGKAFSGYVEAMDVDFLMDVYNKSWEMVGERYAADEYKGKVILIECTNINFNAQINGI